MSSRGGRARIFIGGGIVGFAVALVLWGRQGAVPTANATQPPAGQTPAPFKESSDYSKRVVAYIYESIPITREEFGEYLIARCGVADRLNNMVNRTIIEHEAKQRGVEVTAAEVEADFNESLKGINTNKTDFVNKVLLPYNKTLYEWKEDVIRPRLLLVKMCRERVTATEEDLRNAYDAYYGERVHCRLIKWRKNEQALAVATYPKIRDNEKEFDEAARHQFTAELAARGGEVPPFGHFTTGNVDMEKVAFALKPGEISQVLETPEGFVVMKCIEHLPPTHAKTLDELRGQLTEDIIKRKIDQHEIPKFFAELRAKAHPKLLISEAATKEDLMSEVRREFQTNPEGSR
jgi:hypothetical protein